MKRKVAIARNIIIGDVARIRIDDANNSGVQIDVETTHRVRILTDQQVQDEELADTHKTK